MQLADPNFMANSRIRRLVAEMREEWSDLDRRIEALDREFIELLATMRPPIGWCPFPG